MRDRIRCEACGGNGMFAPAQPSCRIHAKKEPWIVVERCDTCERFTDDLEAALFAFKIAGWFHCQNNAPHALANWNSVRSRGRKILLRITSKK